MKKSNLILGILLLAFVVVLISFVLNFAEMPSVTVETPGTSILEIREHSNKPISHGAPALGCADCHLNAINNITICTDLCHKVGGMANPPLLIINNGTVGGNVTLPHHNETRTGFKNCLSSSCHEDPVYQDDARYVIPRDPNHEYCDLCHSFGGHGDLRP